MAAIVRMLSREFVRPSSPTPYSQFEVKFSGLDQIHGATQIPMVFFFESQPSSTIKNSTKSQLLKKSLSQTLIKFYPFAGQINGHDSVICNDSGALFLVAEVDANLSVAIQNTADNEISQYLPLKQSSPDAIRNRVPLAVQVTFFSCGGAAIGINFSHKMADAWAFATFFNSWAAICRGETPHAVDPQFGLGYKMFPPKHHYASSHGSGLKTEGTIGKKMVMERFIFPNDKIASLKSLASSGRWKTENPSTAEVVSAYLWTRIIQIAKWKGNSKTTLVPLLAVNLRQGLRPPVADSAMGNFIISSPVSSTMDSETDFEVLVAEFQNAQKAFNISEVGFKSIEYFSDLNGKVNKAEAWICNFISLCGFPLYDVDFGWGKPLLVCPNATSKPGVVLGSAKHGDGIEAWVNLAEEDMAMLPYELLSLASRVKCYPKSAHSRL